MAHWMHALREYRKIISDRGAGQTLLQENLVKKLLFP